MTKQEYDAHRKSIHRAYALLLLGGRCKVCGTTENLEFDHIDRSTKSFTIGPVLHNSWAKLLPELQKCQLLCTEHHLIKTAAEGPWNRGTAAHGDHHRAYTLKCSCDLCTQYKTDRNAKRRKNPAKPQTRELIHGTRAGYLKEKRQGLDHCAECKEANRQYSVDLRNRKTLSQ